MVTLDRKAIELCPCTEDKSLDFKVSDEIKATRISGCKNIYI